MLKLASATLAVMATAGAVVLAQPLPPAPVEKVWLPLYGGAGLTSPQIALDMACVNPSLCYMPGGSNGVGFGIYQFNGQPNSQPQIMNNNNMTFFEMSVVAGGTAANPTGVVAGVDEFGIGAPFEYLQNGNTWVESQSPNQLIIVTESLAASSNGQKVVGISQSPFAAGQSEFMASADGGRTFNPSPINWQRPAGDNCSFPGFLWLGQNADTIYMTYGNEPPQNNGGSSSSHSASSSFSGPHAAAKTPGVDAKYLQPNEIIVSRKSHGQVLVIKNVKTGVSRFHVKTPSQLLADRQEVQARANSQCNYYVGYILKSTDAGKTWTLQHKDESQSFGAIDCFDDNNCATVGFSAYGSSVVVTNNGGASWKQTATTPAPTQTSAENIGAVGYITKNELWLAGSNATQAGGTGLFWRSIDGGMSWTPYKQDVSGIMVFLALVFTGKGANPTGYALGLTAFKTLQIVKYAKQRDPGFFSQKQCPIAGCTLLCQTISFEQETCIPTQGGSAVAVCDQAKNQIIQYIYETTSCVGSYNTTTMPLNQCLNGGNTYFENLCPPKNGLSKYTRRATKQDKLLRL